MSPFARAAVNAAAARPRTLREAWQPRPAVILVDAVDEATDPYRLIVELLEPLASASGRTKIRLLAGTWRGGDDRLLRLFGASAVVLDLDSPANLDAQDVEEYARRTLTAEEDSQVTTPYRDCPELVAAVARAVAVRAGKSFLVAQLTALSLTAADEPVDTPHHGELGREASRDRRGRDGAVSARGPAGRPSAAGFADGTCMVAR